VGQPVEEACLDHRAADQVARGTGRPALVPAGRLLACPEPARETAQVTGVQATERAEQQRLGATRVVEAKEASVEGLVAAVVTLLTRG